MNDSSPCIGVCKLDDDNICTGCFVSLAEIATWTQLSAAQKSAINAMLAERRILFCLSSDRSSGCVTVIRDLTSRPLLLAPPPGPGLHLPKLQAGITAAGDALTD